MTFLHLVRSLAPATGGPAEVVRLLSSACTRRGDTVEVATLDPANAPWCVGFPATVHTFHGRGRFGFSLTLPAWLHRNAARYDAIVVHGLWQFQSLAAGSILPSCRVPWFIFPHGMLDENLARVFPGKHRKKQIYWRLVEHRILRRATAVLFTCAEEQRLAQQTFAPYVAREEIVALGVENPPADRATLAPLFFERFPELAGKRLLLFLGRLHPKKGCDLLVEVFGRTRTPLHLVLAGPCEDAAFLTRLQGLAQGHAVTFAGPLRGHDKWAALAAAEAFILPSHQENFGLAVAEALASGLPALLSDKVNIWREIEADGAGLVASDDAAGVASLLERWLAADHDAMRAAARRCFERRFHVGVMLEQFTALVKKYVKR